MLYHDLEVETSMIGVWGNQDTDVLVSFTKYNV
jgi:hypothetical protein